MTEALRTLSHGGEAAANRRSDRVGTACEWRARSTARPRLAAERPAAGRKPGAQRHKDFPVFQAEQPVPPLAQ